MKVTDENLKVARAVRDALVADADDTHKNTQTCTGSLLAVDLRAVIAAIPEAAPLPAPTGPVAWLVRGDGWEDLTSTHEGTARYIAEQRGEGSVVIALGPLAEPAGKDG